MPIELLTLLAAHVNAEHWAARLYLQASAWCEWQSWTGSAEFFKREAHEELQHAQEWQDYVLDRGGIVQLTGQPSVQVGEGDSLDSWYNAALLVEEQVLAAINSIASQAAELGDWDTVRFCQRYTEAGVEQIRDLAVYVARLHRLAGDAAGLEAFDRERA